MRGYYLLGILFLMFTIDGDYAKSVSDIVVLFVILGFSMDFTEFVKKMMDKNN